MDALTFGTKVLLRHLTFSEARKMPIKEFYLEKVLQALGFTMDEVRNYKVSFSTFDRNILIKLDVSISPNFIFYDFHSSLIYVFYWDVITVTLSKELVQSERSIL